MCPNVPGDYTGDSEFRAAQLHNSGGSIHIGNSSGALEMHHT